MTAISAVIIWAQTKRLKALCDSAQLMCNIKFMEFFSSMQGDRYLHRKQKKGKGLHRSPTNLSP